MGKRKRIGLFFSYNENWIGGTYYIQNLILALKQLRDEQRPELIILTSDDAIFRDLVNLTHYPYLLFRRSLPQFNLLQRGLNQTWRLLFKRNLFRIFHKDIDIFFPASNEAYLRVGTGIYWIPDFQEHYLPDFFSADEIAGRKEYQRFVVKEGKYIVFSSHSTQEDFNEIYPNNKLKQFIMRFAVSNDSMYKDDIDELLVKYALPARYFICCNQFWRHKNHPVVLKAVHFLKQRGTSMHLVFTGKEHDYRSPEYFDEIQSLTDALDIRDAVSFLGFISREDQLTLLKHSLAVIQPSLFEGWSTVIEDGKAANAVIIASDIRVHREQLEEYPARYFFSPQQPEELAMRMMDCLNEQKDIVADQYDYSNNIHQFAETFMSITDAVLNESG